MGTRVIFYVLFCTIIINHLGLASKIQQIGQEFESDEIGDYLPCNDKMQLKNAMKQIMDLKVQLLFTKKMLEDKNCNTPDNSAVVMNSRMQNQITKNDYFYPNNVLNLVEFQGKSYFFNRQQKMSWMDAMSFCRAYNMDLVTIETPAENNFLAQQLQKIGLDKVYVWISGHKIGRDSMLWLNGEKLTYQNWQPKEPNYPDTELCMIIAYSKWWDWRCEGSTFFICEGRE